MTKDNVDPAALVIAVIAVANAPLTTTGAWDVMNTVVGLVVLVVVCAYTVMGERRRLLGSNTERVAVSVVIGLASVIVLAFPLQALRAGTISSHPQPAPGYIDFGTRAALGLGLIITIGLGAWLWQPARQGARTAVDGSSGAGSSLSTDSISGQLVADHETGDSPHQVDKLGDSRSRSESPTVQASGSQGTKPDPINPDVEGVGGT